MSEFMMEMIGAEIPGIFVERSDLDCSSLICPACLEQGCNQQNTHIREVHTELGGNEGKSAYQGTVAYGTCGMRRCCLVITVDGECPHSWEIRIQQDKGINYVTTRMVEGQTK